MAVDVKHALSAQKYFDGLSLLADISSFMVSITVNYDSAVHVSIRNQAAVMIDALRLGKGSNSKKQQLRELRYFPEFDVAM